MNVKTILKSACDILSLDDINTALNGTQFSESQQAIINKLLKCLNYIQNEITTEFIFIKNTEEISAENSFNFSNLTKTILRVISVKDENGNNLNFKLYPDHIKFSGIAKEITYDYIPEDCILTGNLIAVVPNRVYAYGIAREYYLLLGLTDKALEFEKRFKNSLDSFMKTGKIVILPKRTWF